MQLGELAGHRGKAVVPQHLTSSPPTFLSLLPPAIREVHSQEDRLILAHAFSRGNYQQVAEPGRPGRLQLDRLGGGEREARGTVAQGPCAPAPT